MTIVTEPPTSATANAGHFASTSPKKRSSTCGGGSRRHAGPGETVEDNTQGVQLAR